MSRPAIIRQLSLSAALIAAAAVIPAMGAEPKDAKASPPAALQQQKDFEHQLLQSDGQYHPREVVGSSRAKAPAKSTQAANKPTAGKKTQRDLDQEHDRLQSDGAYHPRETVK